VIGVFAHIVDPDVGISYSCTPVGDLCQFLLEWPKNSAVFLEPRFVFQNLRFDSSYSR
jgi:hypothetical protein